MARFEELFVNSPPVSLYHRLRGVPRVLGLARAPILGPLLEVGCGNGATTAALVRRLPGVKVTAVDYDSKRVERARRRVGTNAVVEVGDINDLDFPSGSFGTVVEMNVLHHIADPLTGLRELYRVLRPGGQFLFMDFAMKSYPRFFRSLFPPESLFTREELRDTITAVGFGDVEIRGRRMVRGVATRASPSTI